MVVLNSQWDPIYCFIQSQPYPRRPPRSLVTPWAPIRAPKRTKTQTKKNTKEIPTKNRTNRDRLDKSVRIIYTNIWVCILYLWFSHLSQASKHKTWRYLTKKLLWHSVNFFLSVIFHFIHKLYFIWLKFATRFYCNHTPFDISKRPHRKQNRFKILKLWWIFSKN